MRIFIIDYARKMRFVELTLFTVLALTQRECKNHFITQLGDCPYAYQFKSPFPYHFYSISWFYLLNHRIITRYRQKIVCLF